MEEQIENLGI